MNIYKYLPYNLTNMPHLYLFGNSRYSLPVIDTLVKNDLPVAAVITSPDKPAGRHLALTPNPVKVFAEAHHIPIIQRHSDLLFTLENLSPDSPPPWGLVAAYGRILKPDLLNKFNNHIYNIHPSLLPKYRGPSPLQFQLLDRISQTGVTLINLDEKIDHGPIISQTTDTILPQDTAVSLGERLFIQGARLFVDYFRYPEKFSPVAQDDTQATFTRLLTKDDGFIPYADFHALVSQKSPLLATKFKAYFPWPGVWTKDPNGKRHKLISISPEFTIRTEGQP